MAHELAYLANYMAYLLQFKRNDTWLSLRLQNKRNHVIKYRG